MTNDVVIVTCKNCGKSRSYPRSEIPKQCEECSEPFEKGEFGKDWIEHTTKSVFSVGVITAGIQASNLWLLETFFPGISYSFLLQFSISLIVFLFLLAITCGVVATSSRQTILLAKRHARLVLFVGFFAASIISIPLTVWIFDIPLDWPNIIIGIESNIIASFAFVLLYEVLVQRRLPWLS